MGDKKEQEEKQSKGYSKVLTLLYKRFSLYYNHSLQSFQILIMKKNLAIALAAITICISSNAQVKMPAPSPAQTIKQNFAMSSIELIYSRPSAKGRKVFGDLVPLGKLWRTGANEATKIIFSEPVEIGGKKIDSGSYVLYSIPSEDNWEIILNKGLNNWGIDGYKETEDVVRFRVIPMKTKNMVETFTIQFANIKPESCDIEILWEKTVVNIPITTDIKTKLKAQIESQLQKGDKKPYWEAAQYYFEYEKNLSKALENVNKAIEGYPKGYWMIIYKAKIQKEAGDIKGAMESSKLSQALAKEDGNEDYVKINRDFQKTLTE